jgi:transmembrane sensor
MREEEYWILLSKKITGEATSQELELLKELINSDFEKKAIMENLQEIWNSKPLISDADWHQENEDSYLAHINRLKLISPDFKETNPTPVNTEEVYLMPVKKPFYSRLITYAGIAALITGIILIYPIAAQKEQDKTIVPVKPVNEIAINSGSRTKIQLPDGSQVWVNSGSILTYEGTFNGSSREVKLDGEAYFDVVKDASHPFIVHTSGIDIKVLGTVFNVKAYNVDRTIETTLIQGSIEVINQNQPGAPKIMLKPHEKLVYTKYQPDDMKEQQAILKSGNAPFSISIESLNKTIADSAIVETAWVYNKLIFEEERFEDLALKMERWYNVKINIETERLKNYKMSGSFVNETAEQAIKILQFLVPFRYSIKNNEIKIMKK